MKFNASMQVDEIKIMIFRQMLSRFWMGLVWVLGLVEIVHDLE